MVTACPRNDPNETHLWVRRLSSSLRNEPPAKIIIDSPLAEPLSRGVVLIQYRTENLHIVPSFGPAALAVSPRIGYIHVTADDATCGGVDTGHYQRPRARAARIPSSGVEKPAAWACSEIKASKFYFDLPK